MKRITNILIMILLLVSTVGISVTKHYCGDTLKSIAINMTPDHCCGDDKEPMDCCHDESESFSIDDELRVQYQEHKLAPITTSVFSVVLNEVVLYGYLVSDIKFDIFTKSPPPDDLDIYIKFQSFLI